MLQWFRIVPQRYPYLRCSFCWTPSWNSWMASYAFDGSRLQLLYVLLPIPSPGRDVLSWFSKFLAWSCAMSLTGIRCPNRYRLMFPEAQFLVRRCKSIARFFKISSISFVFPCHLCFLLGWILYWYPHLQLKSMALSFASPLEKEIYHLLVILLLHETPYPPDSWAHRI